MLEDRIWCRDFIDLARQRVAAAYEFIASKIDALSIAYFRPHAGFFVYINLSRYLPPQGERRGVFERECMLAKKLVDGGVFLHPGEEHGIREGWFRVVYTMDKTVVEEGVRRLGMVLEGLRW